MSALDILIKIQASGGGQVKDTFDSSREAATALDTVLTKIGNNRALQDTAKNSEALDNALHKVGANNGLEQAEVKAAHLVDKMNAAKESTENLSAVMEKTRNFGAGLAMAGGAGLMLENHLADVATQADSTKARLHDLFEQQNRLKDFSAVDGMVAKVSEDNHEASQTPVREAAVQMASDGVQTRHMNELLEDTVRQARTVKKGVDEVGTAMAKAYTEGSLTRLKRINILFTTQQEESVKAAYGISQAAGQMEFMRVVTESTNQNAVALGKGLTEAEKAANDFAREGEKGMVSVGEGANDAKTQINEVLSSILHIVNGAPGLEHAAGYLGYFVSGGATVVGSLLAVGSQIAMMSLSMSAAGVTAETMWATMTTGAVTAGTAIWAAMAPVLGMIAAIAAIAIVAAAAMYMMSGAADAQDQASDDQAALDERAKKMYDSQQKRLAEGKHADTTTGETFEQYQQRKGFTRDSEVSDSAGTSGAAATSSPDDLKKQIADALALAKSPAPSVTTPMPTSLPPTSAGVDASRPGALGSSSLPGTQTGASSNIEELEDEAARSKKNYDPNSVQERERMARRAEKHQREAERESKADERSKERDRKKQEREQKKAEREAAKEKKGEDKDSLMVQRAQIELEREDQIADLEDALDKAKEDGDAARVRSLTYQIEHAKAEAKYDEAMAAAAQTADGHQSALQEIAKLNLQHDERKAERAADKAANSESHSKHGALNAALSRLRGGESIFDIAKDKSSTRSGGNFSGDSFDSEGGSSQGAPREFSVRVNNAQTTEPNGDILVKFVAEPLRIKRSPLERAVGRA